MESTHESLRPRKTNVTDVTKAIEKIAPKWMALPNDPIGLQVGDGAQVVEKIVVALDASPKSASYCDYHKAQLLVTHHPLIYSPLKGVSFIEPVGKTVQILCQKGIALYAAHTNWDVAPGGVNDSLAQTLELKELRPLGNEIHPKAYKLIIYTPKDSVETLISALSEAGAGVIGKYARCAFKIEGEGTFEPLPGADPRIGDVGRRETVNEVRLEMRVETDDLTQSIDAIMKEHPYEEPAFDIISLASLGTFGIGRIGKLDYPMTFEDFSKHVSAKLNYEPVRSWGAANHVINQVAVVGGSGGDYIAQAQSCGADVLVTGEVRHHHTWDAESRGVGLIDASHEATEMPGVRELAIKLEKELAPLRIQVQLFED